MRFRRARSFARGLAVSLGVVALAGSTAAFRWSAQKGDQPPHVEPRVEAIKRQDDKHNEDVRLMADTIHFDDVAAWDAAAFWGGIEALARDYQPPPAPRPVPAPRRAPARRSLGACGGATNGADAFIDRESGGDPNARNASGAWGCYQIMPGTWSASCTDLGQYGSASTGAQAACASRLPMSAWISSGPT